MISGEAEGTSIALNGELVIGRSMPELDALAADTELSRVHARLWRTADGGLMIEDLGSRNGTYVNGARIGRPETLNPGDEVRAGRTTMELVEAGEQAPTYDALVEPEPEEPQPRHAWRPATIAAVAAGCLIAGGAIGAAVTHERRGPTTRDTLVMTRTVRTGSPRPQLAAPAKPVVLPAQASVTHAAGQGAFVRAYCGRGATASHGVCACAYDELIRGESYAELAAQVAAARGRVPQAVASAARTCGAG